MGMVLDSANDWKSIHAELDLNGDGRLDLAELTAFMKALVVKPRVKTVPWRRRTRPRPRRA